MNYLPNSSDRIDRYRARNAKKCQCGVWIDKKSKRCLACYRASVAARWSAAPTQLEHGYARKGKIHPLHQMWRGMLQRCNNPNNARYASYGGRGILVCERWCKFVNYMADILAEIGPRPKGKGKGGRALYSIDRKDNDVGYQPGNVRWATSAEQGTRTTRSVSLSYKGRTMPVRAWASQFGITIPTLRARKRLGWSDARCIEQPVRRHEK